MKVVLMKDALTKAIITVTTLLVLGTLSVPVVSADDVIDPKIERRDIVTPDIDDESYEITLYYGSYKVDGFQSNSSIGIRGAYHFSSFWFSELNYAQSKISDETFEGLGFPSILEDESVTFYDLSIGANVLPGQFFIGSGYAVNVDTYLIAGLGKTAINEQDFTTLNIGGGVRILPTDWLSVHLDFRDYIMEESVLNSTKSHNMAFSIGVGVYF